MGPGEALIRELEKKIIEIYTRIDIIGEAITSNLDEETAMKIISRMNKVSMEKLGKTWDGRVPVKTIFRDPTGKIIKEYPAPGWKYGISD